MIGELINKFEESDNQTVEHFNSLFPMSPLLQSADYTVQIGPLFGNSREIIVNGKKIYHEITVLKSFRSNGLRKKKQFKVFEKNGNLLGIYFGYQQAVDDLNLSKVEFYDRIRKGEYLMEEVV